MITTAIIGRGMAGTVFHRPLIEAAPGFALAAMVGRADAADIIADPAIDLIVVATPNNSHFDLAAAAINAGKHVVIDKPFVLTLPQADALIARAAARKRLLIPFHNRRWDGDFMTVEQLVRSGRLGDILLAAMHWDRFRPVPKGGWREADGDGSGLLWDLGPHLVDQALRLFGAPDAVLAETAIQRPHIKADDYFQLTLDYGALRIVIGAACVVASPRPRFALHGTKGSFVKFGVDPQEAALKDAVDPLSPAFGEEIPASFGTLTCGDGRSDRLATLPGRYIEFYAAARAAIEEGIAPPVAASEARAGVALLLAAQESAAKGARISTKGLGWPGPRRPTRREAMPCS